MNGQRFSKIIAVFITSLVLQSLLVSSSLAAAGDTVRISITTDGTQGNGYSRAPVISGNGRFIVFETNASNFIYGDTNNSCDIFVYDRVTGAMERVSVSSDETQGNNVGVCSSYPSAISYDGRFIAFFSGFTNLVSEDTNGWGDIFVRDRHAGTTERISVASDGTQGDGEAMGPAMSADGRYIAFFSNSTNLVSGDTNARYDVFIHDRTTGITERLSVASNGAQGNDHSSFTSEEPSAPAITADGRYVVFSSNASNLVSGDTNGTFDVFVHDNITGTTERVSVSSDGTQGDNFSPCPSISADGRYVAFQSMATNLVSGDTNGYRDIFIHDRILGTTERISIATNGVQGNSDSFCPFISANGRLVAFKSLASNIVNEDTNGKYDVFVHDCITGITERISVASDGTQGNGDSPSTFSRYSVSLSDDGVYIVFESDATNLVMRIK